MIYSESDANRRVGVIRSWVVCFFCPTRKFFTRTARMDFNRKVMVFSVSVLGVSLATFLFAYMVFGDNTDEDLRTLRQTNVSLVQKSKFR